jgi:hypothetical protein
MLLPKLVTSYTETESQERESLHGSDFYYKFKFAYDATLEFSVTQLQ